MGKIHPTFLKPFLGGKTKNNTKKITPCDRRNLQTHSYQETSRFHWYQGEPNMEPRTSQKSRIPQLFVVYCWLFMDSTMGCITIFHHHLGNTVCFFFPTTLFYKSKKTWCCWYWWAESFWDYHFSKGSISYTRLRVDRTWPAQKSGVVKITAYIHLWWFQIFLEIFTPILGEMEFNLTFAYIFFKWVETQPPTNDLEDCHPMWPWNQVPYKGRTLSKDELNLQIHSWLQRGVIDARIGRG